MTFADTNQPSLPFARGSDTSKAAAESVREGASKLRQKVLDLIRKRDQGATCDELEEILDMRHQTCSARVHELAKTGAIVLSGERRPTRSGRKAFVYKVKR